MRKKIKIGQLYFPAQVGGKENHAEVGDFSSTERENETACRNFLIRFFKILKMIMTLRVILIASIVIVQTFCSCQDNPIKSEPDPGNRNYEWELDTLNMPMNYLSAVWGATADDVWAIGGGGTQYDRLLHYDGTKWSTYTKEVIWCSGFTVFGFSADDVWMGGGAGWLERGAGIWHYDGVEWTQNYVYSIEETYHSINVCDIWGPSPDDVYACGRVVFDDGNGGICKGFVLHYDGVKWQKIVQADFNSEFLRIRKEKDNVYVFSYGLNRETGDGDVEFYQVKDNELIKMYSNKESEINWASMSNIDGKIYFVIGREVFRYQEKKFRLFLSIDNVNFYTQVTGRNEKDLFIAMSDGIAHYNGTDVEYIYRFPLEGMSIIGHPLILDEEIFYGIIYLGTQWYNMVLHGKLVE